MQTLHTRLKDQLRLYLVTDELLCGERGLAQVVQAAVQGGVSCVQLREKQRSAREFVSRARALKALLSPLGIPLVVNDRVDVAIACGADGVHLGQSDLPVDLARGMLPPHVFIGWSVETEADIQRAKQLPVDYLGISPVFSTPTKTDTANAWGLEGLKRARRLTVLPLVAIGGIQIGNAAQVVQAGADGLAVVSAICAAPDPALAASRILAATQPQFLKASRP